MSKFVEWSSPNTAISSASLLSSSPFLWDMTFRHNFTKRIVLTSVQHSRNRPNGLVQATSGPGLGWETAHWAHGLRSI